MQGASLSKILGGYRERSREELQNYRNKLPGWKNRRNFERELWVQSKQKLVEISVGILEATPKRISWESTRGTSIDTLKKKKYLKTPKKIAGKNLGRISCRNSRWICWSDSRRNSEKTSGSNSYWKSKPKLGRNSYGNTESFQEEFQEESPEGSKLFPTFHSEVFCDMSYCSF